MATLNKSSTKLFTELDDDCILLIIDEIAKIPPKRGTYPENIKNLSIMNKRLRHLCEPALLKFPNGKLDLRSSLQPDIEGFNALSRATFILSILQGLDVNLYLDRDSSYDGVFTSFVTATTSMRQLSQLNMAFNDRAVAMNQLRQEFLRIGASLPTIEVLHLRTATNSDFILKACPQLKTFVVEDCTIQWKQTFAILNTVTSLCQLEINITESIWLPHDLREIMPYIKCVPALCIKGELGKIPLHALASEFRHLPKLESLSITSAKWSKPRPPINGIFTSSPACFPREYPVPKSPDSVATPFFTICPALKSFHSLGRFSSEAYERDSDGKAKLITNQEASGCSYGFPTKFNQRGYRFQPVNRMGNFSFS